MTIKIVLFLVVLLLLAAASLRVLKEYERGVSFRLGRLREPLGPGVQVLLPGIDKLIRVDLRVVTLTIPPQEVITRDNVPARVNAVVLFRVVDPVKSVMSVENHAVATSQIAQTTLRSVVGRADLDTLLAHRADLNEDLAKSIAAMTEPWGVKVDVVETLLELGADHNSTVVFPLPMDIIGPFLDAFRGKGAPGANGTSPVTHAAERTHNDH